MPTIGLLYNTDRLSGPRMVEYARTAERHGIDYLWLPELFGREPFATAGYLLGRTSQIKLATGIANVYARDATAAAAAAQTLAEFSGERFELGLGVSNQGLNQARGHTWEAPVPRLRRYLEQYKAAQIDIPNAPHVPLHIAAHADGLWRLAAQTADGITTYLMPPQHTARARAAIGPDLKLTAMTMVALSSDADVARRVARKATAYYLGLDYYHRAWSQLGFNAEDFAGGGSDRLVDDLVCWGSIEKVRARLDAFTAAGATQVVLIALNTEPFSKTGGMPNWDLVGQLTAAGGAPSKQRNSTADAPLPVRG